MIFCQSVINDHLSIVGNDILKLIVWCTSTCVYEHHNGYLVFIPPKVEVDYWVMLWFIKYMQRSNREILHVVAMCIKQSQHFKVHSEYYLGSFLTTSSVNSIKFKTKIKNNVGLK